MTGWWLPRLGRAGLPCQGAALGDALKSLPAFLYSLVAFLVTPRGHMLSSRHSMTGCDGCLTQGLGMVPVLILERQS